MGALGRPKIAIFIVKIGKWNIAGFKFFSALNYLPPTGVKESSPIIYSIPMVSDLSDLEVDINTSKVFYNPVLFTYIQ